MARTAGGGGWHAALLRAVNLAGRNKVAMSDLCAVCAAVGLGDARSVLQSGNVVFRASGVTTQIERRLASALGARLGLATDVFVRTPADLAAVIRGNPFPREAKDDPSHLLVAFLTDAPGSAAARALQAAVAGREVTRVVGRHAYIVYPDGIGRSRLTSAVIEKALGTRATGRNWNTVLKLAALVGA